MDYTKQSKAEYFVKNWEGGFVAGPFKSGDAARKWRKENGKDVTNFVVVCEIAGDK